MTGTVPRATAGPAKRTHSSARLANSAFTATSPQRNERAHYRPAASAVRQLGGAYWPLSLQAAGSPMRALRGLFFFLAACAGCFADGSVKQEISKTARVFVALFSVLFVIAEAMELLS